jgi:endonuclease-3 related protein
MNRKRIDLAEIYSRLRKRFGFQDWWPGETKDEIVIGAILTQQASWNNVEKAIEGLKSAGKLSLRKIARTDTRTLERLIKPSGFYRQKSRRLKGVASYVCERYGGLGRLFEKDGESLREELLSLNGIGEETADSIALYAAGKPFFVIDAYTRRAMHRIDPKIPEDTCYDLLRSYFQENLDSDIGLYKDFHAQFVELGKRHCKTKPVCRGCPLGGLCAYRRQSVRNLLYLKKAYTE